MNSFWFRGETNLTNKYDENLQLNGIVSTEIYINFERLDAIP